MRVLFLILYIVLGTCVGVAQNSLKTYHEPYIKLGYDVTENYSHEYKIEKRTIFYDEEIFKLEVKQLDISHFSTFSLNDNQALAAGIQYRFRENFEDGKKNELRFTQEFTFSKQPHAFDYEHRLRSEQRITSTSTSHRFRYKFTVSRALSGLEIDKGEAYLKGGVETLLTIANTAKPEYVQRLSLGLGWVLTEVLKLELITEYRLDDFTQNLGHEIFVVTGMKIDI